MSVRYAWANNPEGANLYNKKGLPASPFLKRTNNRGYRTHALIYPLFPENTDKSYPGLDYGHMDKIKTRIPESFYYFTFIT